MKSIDWAERVPVLRSANHTESISQRHVSAVLRSETKLLKFLTS